MPSDSGEDSVVILGVFSHPGVTVVDVTRLKIVVETIGHADEPLGEIIGLESIIGTRVSEINDQFEGFRLKRLQGEENVIDQEITVHLRHFETTGDVVEHRSVVLLAETSLGEERRRSVLCLSRLCARRENSLDRRCSELSRALNSSLSCIWVLAISSSNFVAVMSYEIHWESNGR